MLNVIDCIMLVPCMRKFISAKEKEETWSFLSYCNLNIHCSTYCCIVSLAPPRSIGFPFLALKSFIAQYYGYQLSKAGRKFVEKFSRSNFDVVTGNWLRFQWRLVWIDVNGSKACELAGDDIVTIGNKESCPW